MASTIKVDKIEGSTGSTVTVPTGQTLTVTDGIPVASGGTGLASFTAGDILYATGATTLVKLAKGTGRQGLQTNSGATAPEWVNSPQSLMTAQGDILYASGANTLAKLAKGSGSDTLKMNSGATAPEWVTVAAAAGGAWTKISNTTASSDATIDFTSLSSDYQDFKVIGSGVVPVTDGTSLYMRFSIASSFITSSSYRFGYGGHDSDNNEKYSSGNPDSVIMMHSPVSVCGNDATESMYFEAAVANVHSTTTYTNAVVNTILRTNNSRAQPTFGGGVLDNAAAVDGIQFFFDSGNVSTGEFTLYGRKIT